MHYAEHPTLIRLDISGCEQELEAVVRYEAFPEERRTFDDPGAPEHFAILGVEITTEDKYRTRHTTDLLPHLSESYLEGLARTVKNEIKEACYG